MALFKKRVFWAVLAALALIAGGAVYARQALAADRLPGLRDLPAGQWTWLYPGGDTRCAFGQNYRFLVRPAAHSDKLLIFFEGGGACWDGTSCDPAYSESVAGANNLWRDQTFDYDIQKDYMTGIFNPARSPVADYNMVVVSYCTGDLGWGNATAHYTTPSGQDLTVYHNGADNAQAVLDWAYRNFKRPAQVAVVGCSAGALTAVYDAPGIIEHYPHSRVTELGDSYMLSMVPDGLPFAQSWNYRETMPRILRQIPADKFNPKRMLLATTRSYPYARFGMVNNYLDATLMGTAAALNGVDFSDQAALEAFGSTWIDTTMRDLVSIDSQSRNFYSMINGGDQHCVVNSDELFYGYHAGDVQLQDWFAGFEGHNPSSVTCDIASGECYTPSADGTSHP